MAAKMPSIRAELSGLVGLEQRHDDKLVRAGAREDGVVRQGIAQAFGDGFQQLVAGFVADGIVDMPEVVNVHGHDRQHIALADDPELDDFFELLEKMRLVGQAGQRIEVGGAADFAERLDVQMLHVARILADQVVGDPDRRADPRRRCPFSGRRGSVSLGCAPR